jgi:hypothetical protein
MHTRDQYTMFWKVLGKNKSQGSNISLTKLEFRKCIYLLDYDFTPYLPSFFNLDFFHES